MIRKPDEFPDPESPAPITDEVQPGLGAGKRYGVMRAVYRFEFESEDEFDAWLREMRNQLLTGVRRDPANSHVGVWRVSLEVEPYGLASAALGRDETRPGS